MKIAIFTTAFIAISAINPNFGNKLKLSILNISSSLCSDRYASAMEHMRRDEERRRSDARRLEREAKEREREERLRAERKAYEERQKSSKY